MEYQLPPAHKRAFERLKAMMHAYLVERDAEKALTFYTEDVQSIGTGVQEVAFNKEQLRRLLEEEIRIDPLPFQISFEQVVASGRHSDTSVSLYTVLKVEKLLPSGIPICVAMRQTALMCESDGEFYIRAVHVSVPAAQQKDDEYYPIKFGEKTVQQRREQLDSDLLRLMSENMSGGILGSYSEPEFPLYFINDHMLRHLGYTYEEYLESTKGLIGNSIHAGDRKRVEKEIMQACEKNKLYAVTYRMLKKDGDIIWIHEKGRCITTEDGREATLGVCIDITAQVFAENELSFLEQSKIGGIFKARMDEKFTVLYANDSYYKIHGITRQEMRERYEDSASRLVHPDDAAEVDARIADAIDKRQESLTLEYRVIRGDGKVAWLHASAGLTATEDGFMLSGMVINIDERKRFEEQLQWSEKRFQIAISQTKINVWEYDLSTRSILQTEKSYAAFGIGMVIANVPESMIESGTVHPDDAKKYMALYTKLHQGEAAAEAVVRIRATDGAYYWEKINYTNVFDEYGVPIRAVAVSEDITAQKEAEQRFFQEEHLRELLSADVMLSAKVNLTKNEVLHLWSDTYPPDMLPDICSYDDLFAALERYIANPGDKKRYAALLSPQALSQAIIDGQRSLNGEYRCTNSSGRIVWCSIHLTLLCEPDTGEWYAFGYIRDINERKKTELALRERAERDALTGLYNRQTAESMIDQQLYRQRGQNNECAFFIIDMDDFKQINDRYGHYVGDLFLEEVGRILREDSHGISGRLGGDEFIVFFGEIPDRQWAREKAALLCERLNVQYNLHGETLRVSASVGVVIADPNSTSFQKMFQQADAALYDAKFHGKAQYTSSESTFSPVHDLLLENGCIAKQHMGERCMQNEMADAVLVIDEETHDILFMNGTAQKIFAIEDYQGKKCYEIVQGFTQPCVFCQNHLPDESGYKTWENTNALLRKRFMIRDKMIRWDGRRARLELFTDMSEHEELLRNKVQAEHVLLECISLLLASESLETAIHGVLKNLGEFYRADRTYYARTEDERSVQIAPQDWHAPGIKAEKDNVFLDSSLLSHWLESLKLRRVVAFYELEQMRLLFPVKYALLKEKQVTSYAAVAVLDGAALIGYIGIENPRENLDNTTLLQSLSYFLHNEISKRSMRDRQAFMERHDAMTGILNWQSYSQFLSQMHPEALSSLGILAAEINHLRLLNQEYGQAYGNKLIKTLAERLQEKFGEQAVFRLSGGSFAALCQDITYPAFLDKAERLRSQTEREYPGAVAFGWSWADEDIQPDRLMNNAQELLTITQGGEREYDLRESRRKTIRLQRLMMAMREKRFQIYLQPKAEISTGRIVGAEALIRYVDEVHGVVPPIKFIPQLEAENTIRFIDFFVLEEVCVMLKGWQEQGISLFPISMNFSRSTLMEDGVVEKIKAVSDRYGVERSLLEIEITESKGEMDRSVLKTISRQLIGAGYCLSLDDFGAEYSNISILSAIPLKELKFDKSVINDLYSNPTTRLLIANLIRVCQEIGVDSVAEGVEEPEQLELLKSFGCTYAQGYLFNKPIPVPDFVRKYLEGALPSG